MAPPRPPPTESELAQCEEWKQKGNTAFRSKNYTEALRCYTEAIALNPQSETLYSNRSATYLSLSRLPMALNDAKRAVEIAPNWPKAHRRKASVLDAMKRYQEARVVYEQTLKILQDETVALEEGTRKKETEEARRLLQDVKEKQRKTDKEEMGRVRVTQVVERMPGWRILKESERRVREEGELIGEWPPVGSCFRQLWLAEMQFQNAYAHLTEYHHRPLEGMPWPGMIFGRLQTLEELTSALMEDHRVIRFPPEALQKLQLCLSLEQSSRHAIGPDMSPADVIAEYNRRLTEPVSSRPRFLRNSNVTAANAYGWDYVRPALQLSIRAPLLSGLMAAAAHEEDLGVADFTRAAELCDLARARWPNVDGSLRGRTLEETFVRQIKIHLAEALVTDYMARSHTRTEPENRAAVQRILELGNWIMESVIRNPKPPGPQDVADRVMVMRWWGMYYTHYAGPLARAYSVIGYAHLNLARFARRQLDSPTTGKKGPLVDDAEHLTKAAYAYARSAAWFPVDEPNRCNALWYCVFAMVKRGGYYLADFEVIRDMALKCPDYYGEYFPVGIVGEKHPGRVAAGEMEGTTVGGAGDQICSPLAEWGEGVEVDNRLLEEVIQEYTGEVVRGGGLLKCSEVVREVWGKRGRLGEPEGQVGGERVWGELPKETREGWAKVWEEHVAEENPTAEG